MFRNTLGQVPEYSNAPMRVVFLLETLNRLSLIHDMEFTMRGVRRAVDMYFIKVTDGWGE